MPVRPSASNNSTTNGTDFHEIWHLNVFRKYGEKVQVALKSNQNNRHFSWKPVYIYDNISLNSS